MNRGFVTCKECHQRFSYQQWHEQKICENPKCNCPQVQEAMKLAQQTIDKMKDTKPQNTVVNSFSEVPSSADAYQKDVDLYEIFCPKVMQIKVTPPGVRVVIQPLKKKHRK
jgi:hypothetical protein